MIVCPKCKSASNHRMKRKKRVKMIPGTETYACDYCNNTYTWIFWLKKAFSFG